MSTPTMPIPPKPKGLGFLGELCESREDAVVEAIHLWSGYPYKNADSREAGRKLKQAIEENE